MNRKGFINTCIASAVGALSGIGVFKKAEAQPAEHFGLDPEYVRGMIILNTVKKFQQSNGNGECLNNDHLRLFLNKRDFLAFMSYHRSNTIEWVSEVYNTTFPLGDFQRQLICVDLLDQGNTPSHIGWRNDYNFKEGYFWKPLDSVIKEYSK